MDNLGELLNYVNFIAEKEKAGYTMTPAEYNSLLPVVTQEFANMEYDEYERTQKLSDTLRVLETYLGGTSRPLTIDTNGHGTLPSDYWHVDSGSVSLKYVIAYDSDGEPEVHETPIDVLTNSQFVYRKSSRLEKPTRQYPACTFRNTYMEVLPKDLRRIEMMYLRYPVDPIYDYYIDAFGDNIYLLPSTTHTLTGTEEGSAGQVAPTIVTSTSVEIEFPKNTYIRIARLLLSKIGISLGMNELVQYSEMQQIKQGNE